MPKYTTWPLFAEKISCGVIAIKAVGMFHRRTNNRGRLNVSIANFCKSKAITEEMQEANVNLFLNAPETLKSLKEILPLFISSIAGGGKLDGDEEAINRAFAAIHKSEGI